MTDRVGLSWRGAAVSENCDESNTKYAQGGIAAVMDPEDSAEQHARDTMVAGVGLCHEIVVDICAREGPELLRSRDAPLGTPTIVRRELDGRTTSIGVENVPAAAPTVAEASRLMSTDMLAVGSGARSVPEGTTMSPMVPLARNVTRKLTVP